MAGDVANTRDRADGSVRRTRTCRECGYSFRTRERVVLTRDTINREPKSDGTMARYIDVEPLEDKLKEHIRKTEIELMLGALSTFLRLLDITPTADVAPVRHGMWVDVDRMQMHDLHGVLTWGNSFKCTECNFKTFAVEGHMSQYHYCPNCGARMDGDE